MELHHLVYPPQPARTPFGVERTDEEMPSVEAAGRFVEFACAANDGAYHTKSVNDDAKGVPMINPTSPRSPLGERVQALYVRVLLRLLPLPINLFKHVSPKIRAEVDYLADGYTFMLSVRGTSLACVCQRDAAGTFHRVPPARVARDVEPGSGLASAQPGAVAVDYVIDFRSLAYAFRCFSGGMTLKGALAERAFSTRGPNDTGVALTYLFTALLRLFFGWRATYRTSASWPSAVRP
ncbi:D-alanyl-D-alanine carboxypeptidase [Gordonibacter sp.]|nr:D-alanyl-D-alanine carboxypeptidase [Gordonibacter sp.]